MMTLKGHCLVCIKYLMQNTASTYIIDTVLIVCRGKTIKDYNTYIEEIRVLRMF